MLLPGSYKHSTAEKQGLFGEKKKSSTKQDMVIFTTFWQLLGFRKAEKKNIPLTSPAEVELNQPTLRFPPEQLCLSEMST